MTDVWVVTYDDRCPDPARYIEGVFPTQAKAQAFVDAEVAASVASVASMRGNPPDYLRRPSFYESNYEIDKVAWDPEGAA